MTQTLTRSDRLPFDDSLEEVASETRRASAVLSGVWILGVLVSIKLALHLIPVGLLSYGYFIDELYYLAASQHLAWGYVDMPPLVPMVTALLRATLGDSLLAVRLLPTLAGALTLGLTWLLTRRLGGSPAACTLAAIAVLVSPIRLVIDSFHSMNAFEPVFWMGCALVLLHLLDSSDPGDSKGWLVFGALAGVGLLNKHSMALFGFSIVVGLLAVGQWRVFTRRWIWLGGLVALTIALPNLIWVVSHGFPHLEMLGNIQSDGRNVELAPLVFVGQQILANHPLALPLWAGGLMWLLFSEGGRRYRSVGVAYLVVLGAMLLFDGRIYYPAPFYPVLFATGAVALEAWIAGRGPSLRRHWRGAAVAYAAVLFVVGALLAPISAPLLSPEALQRYSEALHFEQPRIENHELGPLPQLFADRFGWPEMAEEAAQIFHSLPEAEQAGARVFGQNYGQAGAIDLYGPELGLPPAISGHLAYHDWGPGDYQDGTLIVLDDDRETLEEYFESVEYGGRVEHPYSMPYEHFDVWICRRPKVSLHEIWPALRELR